MAFISGLLIFPLSANFRHYKLTVAL